MLRWTKWVTPMAALVLMVGFGHHVLADDASPATMPEGKATVTVTVVDGDGKAVAGADVAIAVKPAKAPKAATTQPDANGRRPKLVPFQKGESGADGTFAFTKVPNGDFVITARLTGTGAGRGNVTVSDDKDGTVSVTLKARKPKAN